MSTSHLHSSLDPTVCDVEVIAQDDETICSSGIEIQLNSTINGPYTDFEWFVDDVASGYGLNDNINVSTELEFCLQASYLSDENIIENGDFEDGNSGFTSEYDFATSDCDGWGILGCTGDYAILDDANDGHSGFTSCSGSGNMLVANGATSTINVWCQEVCVEPGAMYTIKYRATSVVNSSAPSFQMSIDGNDFGSSLSVSTSTCSWEEFEEDWTSVGETNIEICIYNEQLAGGGNDWAIDDIEMFRTCVAEDCFMTVLDPNSGCTDPNACNYNSLAICDDGSCIPNDDPGNCNTDCFLGDLEIWNPVTCACEIDVVIIIGCTEPNSCNYDSNANCEDGSCIPNDDPGTCNLDCTLGDVEFWNSETCQCDSFASFTLGCTDPNSCNYDPNANCDDGSCIPNDDPGTCNIDCTLGDVEFWNFTTCQCEFFASFTLGCTDPNSCNYDPAANCNDGSCIPNDDPGTCNTDCSFGDLEVWNPATCECDVITIEGCTDPNSCNYNPNANCDDGSCIPNDDPGTCNTDCTLGDLEVWNSIDCQCEIDVVVTSGCTDPNSCNYDPNANCDDGSCIPNDDPGTCNTDCTLGDLEVWNPIDCQCEVDVVVISGCTDPNSCNYNPNANCEDGSCIPNDDPGTCNTDCTVGDLEVWNPIDCQCEVDVAVVTGCTDPNSCNYNPNANCDDGSCIPNDDPGTCNTDCTLGDLEVWNSIDCQCEVDVVVITGCTDPNSCNYDPNANCDDGSCIPNDDPGTCNTDCTLGDLEVWNPIDCQCEVDVVTILGCTNNTANNFDENANCDDGSCVFPCPDPGTCNDDCLNGNLEIWDGDNCQCIESSISMEGCTDPNSCNYNPNANCDDGSCIPNDDPGTCNTDCTLGDLEVWNSIDCQCEIDVVVISGCTDPNSCNYDPNANCDDGSCIPNTDPGTCNTDCSLGDVEIWNPTNCMCDIDMVSIQGCTDPNSCNYDPNANCDDGSCIPNTDPGTCNIDCTLGDVEIWNPTNCMCDIDIVSIQGCTDPNSCNYDPNANCDDGSCIPNTDPGTCNIDCALGNIEVWNPTNCMCDIDIVSIQGCTDPNSCNFDPNANCDDGSCIPNSDPGTCNSDCSLGNIEVWNPTNCMCEESIITILGCTNPTATNYDTNANCDDGSCEFACPDPGTCNTDCTLGDIEIWDGDICDCITSTISILGCTDINSCNYDPNANCNDGSCIPNSDPGTCNSDCALGDIEIWNSTTCMCDVNVITISGCTDPNSCNYDPNANCDDGSCIPNSDPGTCNSDCALGDIEIWNSTTCMCDIDVISISGCTDPNSCNYDPNANCDDGSCIPNSDPGTCNSDCALGDIEIWNSTTCMCDIDMITISGCTDPNSCNYDPNANCDDGSCIPNDDPGTCNSDCSLGDIEIWNSTTCMCDVDLITISGCTDPNSCNYDPNANCDDGSCIPNTDPGTCNSDCALGDIEIWNPSNCQCELASISVLGCTNSTAINYDPNANCDDGSCTFACPDPGTCNTDCLIGNIEIWDGINCECVLESIPIIGCTNLNSCNYDPNATCDDGSCIPNDDPGTCNTDCRLGDVEVWDQVNCTCIVSIVSIPGCTDPNACNYDPNATCDDNSCIPNDDPGTCNTDCTLGDIEEWNFNDCICEVTSTSIVGCTDPNACNYDPNANCDDGSCIPNTDPGTCNTDCTFGDIEIWNSATCSCDVDQISIIGCTDPNSCNYDPNANCDDGSCISNVDPGICNDDCEDGDLEIWDSSICDCIIDEIVVDGCTNPTANNYDPNANCEDGSCTFDCPDPGTCNQDCSIGDIEIWDGNICDCVVGIISINGCTDPNSCNYNPNANCNDGSCIPNIDPGTCNTDCSLGDLEIWNPSSCQCDLDVAIINGCTDPNSCNYNPNANCDDGSCIPNTDPGTCNTDCALGDLEVWNPISCQCDVDVAIINGCTDPNSCNYNPNANCDDGSCIPNTDPGTCNTDCALGDLEVWNSTNCQCEIDVIVVQGCTNPTANNFDPNANCDDGSCEFACPDPGTCNQDCSLGDIEIWDGNICDCIIATPSILGCTDPNSCNYNPNANCDDGTCIPNTDPGTCNTDCIIGDIEVWNFTNCQCEVISMSIPGCTNPTAENYDSNANCEDGSCTFSCPDPGNCSNGNCEDGLEFWDGNICDCVNGDPPVPCIDDGDCTNGLENWNSNTCNCDVISPIIGCTDPAALNFNMNANCNDNCIYDCEGIADAGTNIVLDCFNPMIQLGGPQTSTGAQYSYEWTDLDGNILSTNITYQIDQADTYVLNVINTNLNCSISDTISIIALQSEPEAVIYTDPSNILDCTTLTVTLSTENQENTVVSWLYDQTINNNNEVVIDQETEVTLIVLDTITGCENTESILVLDEQAYPSINFNPPGILTCNTPNILIDALGSQSSNNIIHQWLTENGDTIPNANSLELMVSDPGLYSLQSIDTLNGCSNIDVILIAENVTPPNADLGPDLTLPCNDLISLQANGGILDPLFNYEWFDQDGNLVNQSNIFQVQQSGLYYVSVQNSLNGCSASDTIQVFEEIDIPTQANFMVTDNPCDVNPSSDLNIQDVIGGTSPYVFEILELALSNTEGTFNGLPSGEITVQITDQNGCFFQELVSIEAIESFSFDLNPSEVSLQSDDSIEFNITTNLALDSIESITWLPADISSCQDCLISTISPTQSSQIEVIIVDIFGCEYRLSSNVTVYDEDPVIFIGNVLNAEENQFINIQSTIDGVLVEDFSIYDRWGNQVFTRNNFMVNDPSIFWDGRLNNEAVVSGVYVYVLNYVTNENEHEIKMGTITVLR